MIYQSEYVFQTKQKIKKTKKKTTTVIINFNNEKATCKIDNVYMSIMSVLALFSYYIFVDNR